MRSDKPCDPVANGSSRWLRRLVGLCLLLVVMIGSVTAAEAYCRPGTNLLSQAFGTTCWECMFPISMSSITLYTGTETAVTPAMGPGIAPYYGTVLCGCVCYFSVCIPGLPVG
ncbi:MAG: hypothetical protein Q8S75_01860, partial [Nitrospirota bacterium]|nr:hypothetical protein [Nitrospirota bacterium]